MHSGGHLKIFCKNWKIAFLTLEGAPPIDLPIVRTYIGGLSITVPVTKNAFWQVYTRSRGS